jgi:hypothetical protein
LVTGPSPVVYPPMWDNARGAWSWRPCGFRLAKEEIEISEGDTVLINHFPPVLGGVVRLRRPN